MPPVLLTKRIEFAAAHRYVKPQWDEQKNRDTFGPCYNEPGHGHNYMLEVTVSGEVLVMVSVKVKTPPGSGKVAGVTSLTRSTVDRSRRFSRPSTITLPLPPEGSAESSTTRRWRALAHIAFGLKP